MFAPVVDNYLPCVDLLCSFSEFFATAVQSRKLVKHGINMPFNYLELKSFETKINYQSVNRKTSVNFV